MIAKLSLGMIFSSKTRTPRPAWPGVRGARELISPSRIETAVAAGRIVFGSDDESTAVFWRFLEQLGPSRLVSALRAPGIEAVSVAWVRECDDPGDRREGGAEVVVVQAGTDDVVPAIA